MSRVDTQLFKDVLSFFILLNKLGFALEIALSFWEFIARDHTQKQLLCITTCLRRPKEFADKNGHTKLLRSESPWFICSSVFALPTLSGSAPGFPLEAFSSPHDIARECVGSCWPYQVTCIGWRGQHCFQKGEIFVFLNNTSIRLGLHSLGMELWMQPNSQNPLPSLGHFAHWNTLPHPVLHSYLPRAQKSPCADRPCRPHSNLKPLASWPQLRPCSFLSSASAT